ncbi:pyrimidine-specific ribonucleoside hydrolase (cytidine/uridine-specific hydrolase) [Escherichia coli]|nr:pyrimidine-specific ribonucleoside hydrolase (cytidine/uridine-specific hydrolase) [Escherichia coli]
MLTLLNRTDIPVAGGAVKPLMRELIIADNVHGESGLDGPALPEPTFAPQNCTAVELMAKNGCVKVRNLSPLCLPDRKLTLPCCSIAIRNA